MDDADLTQERAERETEALRKANIKPEGPAFTGHCAWCEASVEAPRRWCDAECRDQWERRK